jgi:hypothetical protein
VKSPWKSFDKLEPDHEYVVLASSIPPRMAALSPEMGETKFVRWMIDGSQGRPTWNDALRRLGHPTRAS